MFGDLYGTEENSKGERVFWALNENDYPYRCYARRLATGEHCIIYGETGGFEALTAGTAEDIAREFDENIFPLMTGCFGQVMDVDDNGKIILLYLNIRDGYDPARPNDGYVAGYFFAGDMERRLFTNGADMLYLDTSPGTPAESFSIIAHELQHLISYSNTAARGGREMELWINEGLSLAAEFLYAGEQHSRIDYYNNCYDTISRGNTFYVWDGYWEENSGDVLANYSTAYLFFRWLGIQAAGGHTGGNDPYENGIYQAIANSGDRDYRAVTSAAGQYLGGQYGNWESLLSAWFAANYDPNSSAGYKGMIRTVPHDFPGGDLLLAPGEGVYSPGDLLSANDDGPSIRYTAMNSGGSFLSFNANTDGNGERERASAVPVRAERPQAMSAPAPYSLSAAPSYPSSGMAIPDRRSRKR